MLTTHIWQEYLDLVEQLRKTERGKELYAMRKETIERVFADAKEKHAMRYTHHRGLARVSAWVRLKYAAMNFKKIAGLKSGMLPFLLPLMIKRQSPCFENWRSLTSWRTRGIPLVRDFYRFF